MTERAISWQARTDSCASGCSRCSYTCTRARVIPAIRSSCAALACALLLCIGRGFPLLSCCVCFPDIVWSSCARPGADFLRIRAIHGLPGGGSAEHRVPQDDIQTSTASAPQDRFSICWPRCALVSLGTCNKMLGRTEHYLLPCIASARFSTRMHVLIGSDQVSFFRQHDRGWEGGCRTGRKQA